MTIPTGSRWRLDFANDKTAYMMEYSNLVFINDQPNFSIALKGLSKDVQDYDNIYPSIYKIGQSFD